ncbi:MAG: SAM-dependent chlorinase/fluorinase, partial [Deltaproteobacteria bacterium]|nr:SAM-dependent chlorinase/fluorinase [Deltaproteobacteria bacterium]
MKTPSGIITLTTDFGTRDGYAGALKGRILKISPAAVSVDITHDIPPQDIFRGALALRRAALQFPEGTVHLAVVDPGVGTSRAGVIIETTRYFFIGPDNGLLTLAAREDGIRQVVEISESGPHWRKSSSFDGLTMFAPLAALIASGMDPTEAGDETDDLTEITESQPQIKGSEIRGQVVFFDHFGNAVSNIGAALLKKRKIQKIVLQRGKNSMDCLFCRHYAELAGSKKLGAMLNSDGLLELCVFGGSARKAHNL